MASDSPRNCTFTARVDCHFLLHEPEEISPKSLLVVALHGFAGNPEDMLRLTRAAVGPHHFIASVEGPNQFYLSEKTGHIGYGWGVSRHAASSIRLHHEIVQHVLNQAGRDCGIPPQRRLLAGFSQTVALNYRLAATCPAAVGGVMAFCGGVPGNWEDGPFQPVTAAILHIARAEDRFYPPDVAARIPGRLRLRAPDVEFHLIEGPHRFPSKATPIVGRWLQRLG